MVKPINHADQGYFPGVVPRQINNLAIIMGSLLSEKALDLICRIGEIADSLGQPAYLAGGFVRDLLRGVPNLDLDFVVEGDGVAFANHLAELFQAKLIAHDKFYTASLELTGGWKIDVATARTESYSQPGVLPDVLPSTLREDLSRRDFSINAMAMVINRQGFGQVIDIFHGREDLELKQIRILHPRSFWDDPTRIIRAVRFAVRCGFKLEGETAELARQGAALHLMRLVSPPRIREELLAVFQEADRQEAAPYLILENLQDLGLWPDLDPQMPAWEEVQKIIHQIPVLLAKENRYFSHVDVSLLYLMAICSGTEEEAAANILQRLQVPRRYPRQIMAAVSRLNAYRLLPPESKGQPGSWQPILGDLSSEGILLFLAAVDPRREEEILFYLEKRQNTRLAISGADLQELGLPPGPLRRRILEEVYQARLNGAPGSRDNEMALAKKIIDRES